MNYKCYSMKKLMSLKELVLISQINQKSVWSVIIGILKTLVINIWHDLSMVVYELKNIAMLNVKGVDYRCYVFNISKSDAINLRNNSVLDNKGVL